ncbi:Transcription factor spt8, partial [Oleoguttula sp. CCFEE 5521]
MVTFDDDADPTAGSGEEDEDEDMEDVNDTQQDEDQDQEQDDDGGGDDDEDDDNDDNDNEDDDDGDQDEQDSPSRRSTHLRPQQRSGEDQTQPNPAVVLTSPSPRAVRSPVNGSVASFIPPTRPEAFSAQAYDIVPTMAAPQGTSINCIATTPDMHWVFSGGTDGYVRMFNWVDTANGKVPLTVAQKHPFVDSVMKAGSLVTYWENEEPVMRTPPLNGDE